MDINKINLNGSEYEIIGSNAIKHNLDGGTTISSYTQTNQFEVPNDGYVTISSGTSLNDIATLYINNNAMLIEHTDREGYPLEGSIFVRKGMRVYMTSTASRGVATFRALI